MRVFHSKMCLAAWVALAAACVALASAMSPPPAIATANLSQTAGFVTELRRQFDRFKRDFSKAYTSLEEEGRRFVVFSENYLRVQRHNAASARFQLAMNHLSDQTLPETKRLRGYRRGAVKRQGSHYVSPLQRQFLPHEMDWRKKGAVTEVKDQGHCGSCWSFSTTGSLEGQHFRKSGRLVNVSEQQLVDCSGKYGNEGCNGGLMDNAFRYIRDNGGIDTERSYPYTSGQTGMRGDCAFSNATVGATDTGFVDLPSGSEAALLEAVANIGPVSVAIDANSMEFQLYKNGIYENPNCRNDDEHLDHGVLVVGYGVEAGVPYWLVKNSWNKSWGMSGYIRMRRNFNNMCGIATSASYPLV